LTTADRSLAEGNDVAAACCEPGVSEQTYHRWRNQFGGLKADDAKRLKDLEQLRTWLRSDASVTVLPGAHADFIALGVGQDPECSGTVVADEPAAGREGGFDSGNGIVVRNSQIKVNSVALRARFVHLLEPERRTAIGRVH
jgi:hypothetical protein